MLKINRNPSKRDLTAFGGLLPVFVGVFGFLVYSQWDSPSAARWIWSVGAAFWLIYLAVAPLRRWMFVGWMYVVFPIGWTISHLVLAVVYYLVLTPIGLLLRAVGRDPLEKRIEPERSSYWEDHPPPADAKRYFRQF